MYSWIWQHLPGSNRRRVTLLVLVAVALLALLWLVVFPWASVHRPFDQAGFS
ncbi:MAG: hypothetical protein ACLPUO_05685 [Streptosporangiaceae bacterium]|jgi:uncharacterized membrane-anchored protein